MRPIVSKWFKKHRQSPRLSQDQMAQKYGMSARPYIDLEHGTSFPSATTFAQLLTALSKEDAKSLLMEIKAAVDLL